VTVVVDDALLLAVLADVAPPDISAALADGEVFTTASWYYRLGRAIGDRELTGALSAALDALPPHRQARVVVALDSLPDQIGLLGFRRLVPIMRRLDVGRRLNFLTAEAVAVALALDAGIRVTTDSPLLAQACAALGVEHRIVTL
jgi:hypothetical protein